MASVVEKVRAWLNTCPYMDTFSDGIHIDWTAPGAGTFGIMPTGCTTVQDVEDVMGNRTVRKQYSIALYARGWTVDDVARLENTDFLDTFQEWVEEQQAMGCTPKFGDNPDEERITAQNGMLFALSENGQTGLYQIQIEITYDKQFERMDHQWQE